LSYLPVAASVPHRRLAFGKSQWRVRENRRSGRRRCAKRSPRSWPVVRSSRSRQLRRFLELTVDWTLAGRGDDIKETTIAIEAYGRPSSFDPRIDPIIRVRIGRPKSHDSGDRSRGGASLSHRVLRFASAPAAVPSIRYPGSSSTHRRGAQCPRGPGLPPGLRSRVLTSKKEGPPLRAPRSSHRCRARMGL
jgi:hypothetical protein